MKRPECTYLLTGHRIFISTPLYTVASPPTLSITSSSGVTCSYFWATSDTITASCSLQAFGLHSLLFSGLSLPQSESGRFMICPWAIFCTHSTALVFTPPLHFLLHCENTGQTYIGSWFFVTLISKVKFSIPRNVVESDSFPL